MSADGIWDTEGQALLIISRRSQTSSYNAHIQTADTWHSEKHKTVQNHIISSPYHKLSANQEIVPIENKTYILRLSSKWLSDFCSKEFKHQQRSASSLYHCKWKLYNRIKCRQVCYDWLLLECVHRWRHRSGIVSFISSFLMDWSALVDTLHSTRST